MVLHSIIEGIFFLIGNLIHIEEQVVFLLLFLDYFRFLIVKEKSLEIVVILFLELIVIIIFPELVRIEVIVDRQFVLILDFFVEIFVFPLIFILIFHG